MKIFLKVVGKLAALYLTSMFIALVIGLYNVFGFWPTAWLVGGTWFTVLTFIKCFVYVTGYKF